jgi:hypothetical protein
VPLGAGPAGFCLETAVGKTLAAEFPMTSRKWRPSLFAEVDRLWALSEEKPVATSALAIYVYLRVATSPWCTRDEHFQKSA